MEKYEAGDYEGFIKDFSIAIEMDPDNSDLYPMRAPAFMNLGLLDKAMDDANTGLHLDPSNAPLHLMRARLLAEEEQYDAAIEDMNNAISLNPEEQDYYSFRGSVLVELKDYLSAYSDFQTYVLLNSSEDEEDIIYKPGEDDLPERELLSGTISIANNWTEPKKVKLFNQHMKRAIDLNEQKKYEEALDALEIAHNLNPAHEVVFSMRMLIYDTLQDLEKGIANLAEQAQFYPDDSTVRMNLGVLKSKAGKNEEALADLVIASKLDPDNAKIRLTLGTLYLMSGDSQQAIDHLTCCIEFDPTIPDAHLYRASAKEKMDDYLGAIPDLENYIRLGGSPNADIEKMRTHIEELKAEYGWEDAVQGDQKIEEITDQINVVKEEYMTKQNSEKPNKNVVSDNIWMQ